MVVLALFIAAELGYLLYTKNQNAKSTLTPISTPVKKIGNKEQNTTQSSGLNVKITSDGTLLHGLDSGILTMSYIGVVKSAFMSEGDTNNPESKYFQLIYSELGNKNTGSFTLKLDNKLLEVTQFINDANNKSIMKSTELKPGDTMRLTLDTIIQADSNKIDSIEIHKL